MALNCNATGWLVASGLHQTYLGVKVLAAWRTTDVLLFFIPGKVLSPLKMKIDKFRFQAYAGHALGMCRTSIFSSFFLTNWLAATATWSLITQTAGPSGRFGHTSVWDEKGQKIWVHGGSGEDLLNDLWVFDVKTSTWIDQSKADQNRSSTQVSYPSPRLHRHAMVWDPDRATLWISGGFDGGNFVKEVWKYADNTWFRFADSTVPGPSARSDHVAIWDASNAAIWIHGGFDGIEKQDLWKFDTREGSWRHIQVNNPPSARANHVAAWDDTNQALWIHAGHASEVLYRDLWRFSASNSTWSLISSSGPSARAYHVSAWDTLNQIFWIHGGKDVAPRRDLWRFDAQNYKWQLIEDHRGPSRRFDHVAALDVDTGALWIHGGYEGCILRDLWKYQIPTTVTPTATHETDLTACLVLLPIAGLLTILVILFLIYWAVKRLKQSPRVVILPSSPRTMTLGPLSLPPSPPSPPPPAPPAPPLVLPPLLSSPMVHTLQTIPVEIMCRLFPKNTQKLIIPSNPPRPAPSLIPQLDLCVPKMSFWSSPLFLHPAYGPPRAAKRGPRPLFAAENWDHLEVPVFLVAKVQLMEPEQHGSLGQNHEHWKVRPCLPRPTQRPPVFKDHERHRSKAGRRWMFDFKPLPLKDPTADVAPKKHVPPALAQAWRPLALAVDKKENLRTRQSPCQMVATPSHCSQLMFDTNIASFVQSMPPAVLANSIPPALPHPPDLPLQFPSLRPQLPRAIEAVPCLKPAGAPKKRSFSTRSKSTLAPSFATDAAMIPGPGYYDPEHPGTFGKVHSRPVPKQKCKWQP